LVHVDLQRLFRHFGLIVLVAGGVLLAAGPVSARTAATPTAITGPVTAVGPTSATATGTVNPGGLATTWYFEYGTTTGYGSKTAAKSEPAGSSNVGVSASLTGLKPGTTYHYRLVATNSGGTSRGADGIFATSAGPVAVTGTAADLTVTSATLTGSVDPNGRSTTWYFEYGTSTSYGSKTSAKGAGSSTATIGVSAPVSGLTRGKLYHYRLVATSDAGTSRGSDRTFSTSGAPTPVTGSTTSITPATAKLGGTVTPNGLATTWYFEYGTSTSYGSKTSVKSAGSGTKAVQVSAALSGLRAATTYHYRLLATNAGGTNAGSDRAFSTAGPPVARTGPAQEVGANTAKTTGSVDPRGRRTTWYVEYGTTLAYGTRTASKSAGSGFGAQNVTAAISGLKPSTTYQYRLVASNDAGTSRGANASFATAGVTLAASATSLVYGQTLGLAGVVPVKRAGELVMLFAQEFGKGSPRLIATVVTDAAGTWRYLAKPTILTSYTASWNGGLSHEAVVAVRPAVQLRVLTRGRFRTRVAGEHSFSGRLVKLQRRSRLGQWVTVKRVRLDRHSAATFRATLPRGVSTLRIAMSVNQAGSGYLAGFSRTIVYRRS
jgi:hypothetical protein